MGYDVETGLFWCNSRYYNPEWGRWISPDSIEYLDPESINGLNLYCYCGNNPVNYKQRPVFSGSSIADSTLSGTLGVGFVPIVGAIGGSSGIFNQTLKGSFRNGLLFGSGSITSLYADWNARTQISLRKGTVKVGIAGKFSVLNVSGQIGFGIEDLNLSLKAVGDALTISGMAGIFIDPKKNTYFIGVDAKATALSGRVGGQLDIFGLQIESGLSGELGSIGGRLGIGLRPTNDGKMEFYFGSGFALGVGWDFYIRIRFDKLF
ncbi:MAG: RHS repeat-associated core domain-containing protein [Acholeplasmatales bacterium]|nr:RHS repeat-associated core domain-containing protein [Acholeplasmatales bacterium]